MNISIASGSSMNIAFDASNNQVWWCTRVTLSRGVRNIQRKNTQTSDTNFPLGIYKHYLQLFDLHSASGKKRHGFSGDLRHAILYVPRGTWSVAAAAPQPPSVCRNLLQYFLSPASDEIQYKQKPCLVKFTYPAASTLAHTVIIGIRARKRSSCPQQLPTSVLLST